MTEIPLEQEQGFVLLDRDTLRSLFAIEKAARALVDACFLGEPTEEYGTELYYVFCRGQAHRSAHQGDCLWQSLVRAVRGEGAP